MHDPGPALFPTGGKRSQQLRERSLTVPAGGMHDQTGRLVDDQQVVVLVGDRKERRIGQGESLRGPSITKIRRSTPSVIEVSARLNGGQPRGSLTKSVTAP